MRHIRTISLLLSLLSYTYALLLLCYQLPNDSDLLVFNDFFNSFTQGTHWSDWKMPPAPGFVPDLLLYGIGSTILPTAPERLYFASLGQIALCSATAIWLSKKIIGRYSTSAISGIFLALCFVILVAVNSQMQLFLNTNNVHVSATLFGLVTIGIVIDLLPKRPAIAGLFLTLVGCVSTLSSAVYTIAAAAPIATVLMIGIVAKRFATPHLRPAHRIAGLVGILMGQIVCWMTRKFITHHDALKGRVPISFHGAATSLRWFIRDVHNFITPPELSSQIYSGVVVLCMAYVGYKAVAQHDNVASLKVRYVSLLAFSSLFITSFGAVTSGGFVDPFSLRYLAFPISLIFILTIVNLTQEIRPEPLAAASCIAACVLGAATFVTMPKLRMMSNQRTISQALILGSSVVPSSEDKVAECIRNAEIHGDALQAGISGYWFARSIEYRVPIHPMLAVDDSLRPMYWMVNSATFAEPEVYRRFYNFAVVKLTESSVIAALRQSDLPPTARKFDCPPADVSIWYYPDDTLNKLITANNASFVKSPWFN